MLSETTSSVAANSRVHSSEPVPVAPYLQAGSLDIAIIELVSRYSGVPHRLIFHPSRCRRHIAVARQLAMYLLHVCASRNMAEVGALFGRDRTTVAHACGRIEDMRDCPDFDADICSLEDAIAELAVKSDAAPAAGYVLQ